MAWGADTSGGTTLSTITTVQYFDAPVTLNPGETAHCQVTVDFPTTPTDHALVGVYTTLDATSEVWDNNAYQGPYLLPNSPDPGILSFTVRGVYKFRVGVQRTGSTNTLTSATMQYKVDGVSV